jgi:hypothetical protein
MRICTLVFFMLVACVHPAPPKSPAAAKPYPLKAPVVAQHRMPASPAAVVPAPQVCMSEPPTVEVPAWPTNHDGVYNVIVDAGFRDKMDKAIATYQKYIREQYAHCKDPNGLPFADDDPLMPEVPTCVDPYGMPCPTW